MRKEEYHYARLHFWLALLMTLLGADWYLSSELTKYSAFEEATQQRLVRVYSELDSLKNNCRGKIGE